MAVEILNHPYWMAFLLGIVEGLTEFLPVSSTAHIRIVQSLLGLSLEDEFWKMFAIVIQLGAILSVLVYFKTRIAQFHLQFLEQYRKRTLTRNHPLILVLVAFLVTAIPAFLLSKVIGKNLESLTVMGSALLAGGLIMGYIDFRFQNPKTLDMAQMNLGQAIWIGAVQVLSAIFPGTSRSMSTIAAGQIAGLSRPAALEFSFFVSIPTMIAATGYDFLKTLKEGLQLNSQQAITLGIGFTVSFLSAYVVIAGFMAWVKTRGFMPFAIYRILLGIYVLIAMTS